MDSEKLPRSRPSSADETSDETITETADEGNDITEKTIGDKETEEANPISTVSTREPQYLEGLQLVLVIACVTLVCFLVLLDTSIIATAIPRITDQFQSLPDVGWYGGAYQLAGAALQPLSGKMYTYFDNKITFLGFFALFELGSLICGVATSSTMLIVGRGVAGLGMSGLMNGALTIVAGAVPLHKRAALIGIIMGFCQLGVVCGPLLGGAFTEYTTWRWCFYINLPIGGVVSVLLFFTRIPDQMVKPKAREVLPRLHHYLDLVGFAVFAGAAIQILLALQWGGVDQPWKSATIIGLFLGGAGTFVAWGLWNSHKGDSALIPFSLVKQRVVWSAALTQLFIFTNLFVSAFFLPIYFQAVKGVSPFRAGVYVLPSILSQLVTAVTSGILVGKLGYYLPWALASAVLASIGAGLLGSLEPHTSTAKWIGFQVIAGAGRGFGMQMPILAMQAYVKPKDIPVGQAFLSFSQLIGIAVFVVVGNTMFGELLRSGLTKYAPHADAQHIVASGATAFRSFVSAEDLPGVLIAYAKAVTAPLYLASAAAALAFFSSWGMGWVDIRKKKTPPRGDV
ncbi:putative MFS multidrug transporter [Coniochaeta sp. 2T2.1]|nr:putative MFS multidrug transporter [Coniochaeta sp. 2T2.1]